ncbi:DUF4974 domain-containing protein [Chitinophaga lutea]|uniref:DUF4974 domain-containing protein n=1 Tax=Chitinophaga lutea TaxID=2488634 RepID=A0A3N4QLE3_9BACT|nr:FecR domain-containing protein [Chitinophaga lutea]RPE12484.1 DUF4974 domain-containing protein [Chitinophaga lutea]
MHELPDDIPLMRHMLGEPDERIDLALTCDGKFRQHYEALQAQWKASGLLDTVAAVDVDRQWEAFKRRRQKRTVPLLLKIAAAVVGAAILTALLWRQPERHELVHHSMPHGEQGQVVLPDSTKVWLNAGSELTYDARKREAVLQGEAYFEVQADPQHPFYVQAGAVRVEVLGTRFNLMAYAGDSLVSTSLLQGSVRLHSGRDTVLIRPGEKTVWHGQQQKFSTTDTGTETDTRWKDGELVFRKEPLERAFARLERWFGTTVVYDRDSFAGHQITARLEKGETLDKTLLLLQEILPMHYSVNNNVVYIRHK